ncbi:MAG TPA: hypothetical protein VGH28_29060 [Polyangiaceae bacterium]|jgi:hypothetical protein
MHSRAIAVFALLACLGAERRARAQACCVSTSTIFPGRLQDGERGLLGVSAKGAVAFGSFDGEHVLRGQPDGASEIDLGQTLFVTARVGDEPVQINVSVPLVETFRSAESVSDFGGGLGDISFSMRWDVLRNGRDPVVPGIAPLLSVTVPSGTPADMAQNPLGADATGLGGAQLGAGLALEKTFGRMLLALTGTASFHGARTVRGVHSQLGPDLAGTIGASYTFRGGFSLGGALTYTGSWDATVNDASVADSARALTTLALVAALPLRGNARVLGSLFFVPPISGVGQNEIGNVGLSLTLIYGMTGSPKNCDCATGVCHP